MLDRWKVAGTADRIGLYRGQLTVADIKTGKIDYPGKFAAQIAGYARSLPYDTVTDTRGAADLGLDLQHGLVIHLPAGEGRCDLYLVDIEKGWAACQLAQQVWAWRATKGLLKPVTPIDFIDLARTAGSVEDLRELWREAKRHNAITDDFLTACEKRRREFGDENSK